MFQFQRQGVIEIEAEGRDEDAVMEAALEAGADDFKSDGDVYSIVTDPTQLGPVRDGVEKAGYPYLSAEVAYVPSITVDITDPELVEKMEKLIDMLEENDDVQDVWHNWNMPEEEDED